MNCKYQFYQGYYKNFDPRVFAQVELNGDIAKNNEKEFKATNKSLMEYEPPKALLEKLTLQKAQFGEALSKFKLLTAYPGLVTGTGYTHETGNVGEFKIGFYFDHTTGLPYLPGHSIKGALRHAFPRLNQPRTDEPLAMKHAKARYILSLLPAAKSVPAERQLDWVSSLEEQIFESKHPTNEAGRPIGRSDVFLDARISKADAKGRILGSDAITPHGEKKWKNPVPLPFLKVLPSVEWEFYFLLFDTTLDGIVVKAAQKEAMFRQILLDLGVGAKTNVGYGQFTPVGGLEVTPNKQRNETAQTTTQRAEEKTDSPRKALAVFTPDKHILQTSQLKKGKEVYAQVLSVSNKEVQVKLLVEGWDTILPVPFFKTDKPDSGIWCKVKIKDISGKAPKITSISLETNFVSPINIH